MISVKNSVARGIPAQCSVKNSVARRTSVQCIVLRIVLPREHQLSV